MGTSRAVKTCASLRKFFGNERPDLVQLKLENVPLPVTDLEGSLTRKLQRLSISTLPGSRRIDFAWDGLWSALEANRVELSTLTELKICSLQMDRQDQEDIAGIRFWNEALGAMGPWRPPQFRNAFRSENWTCACVVWTLLEPMQRYLEARDTDQVEFHEPLEEPYGALPNCGALVLCDLKIPLIKLKLDLAWDSSGRSAALQRVERGTRTKGSPEGYWSLVQRDRIRERIETLILGMRAPALMSQNWPSVVDVDRRLLKCQDLSDALGASLFNPCSSQLLVTANYEVALRDVKGRVTAVEGVSKSAGGVAAKVEVALKDIK
ncbi:hypothetical protein VTN77DRAFT_9281 [Rasamsonia byssochlamydoides]|uniref:uncharacterized protein n=1 Tax=Rasamsonia byssochlamydoides TaxID=89139 RepID=UPI0037427FA1